MLPFTIWGLATRLKEQVECLAEQLLNGAVLFEGEQLELLRDAGVEIADECLFTLSCNYAILITCYHE